MLRAMSVSTNVMTRNSAVDERFFKGSEAVCLRCLPL